MIKRIILKKFIQPFKYKTKNGYDAQKYWEDRFNKYDGSIRGAGNEGKDIKDNQKEYDKSNDIFKDIIRQHGSNLYRKKILEIGCGSGYYTNILYNFGVTSYLGIDITDVVFPKLTKEYPNFDFLKLDVSTEIIKGKYDIIVMIDVIQHIVNENKFNFAMNNIKKVLNENGIIILNPIFNKNKKRLFYVNNWGLNYIKQIFYDFKVVKLVDFRNARLMVLNYHKREQR